VLRGHQLYPIQVCTWKRQAIYLEEITGGFKARRDIQDWMNFYNQTPSLSA